MAATAFRLPRPTTDRLLPPPCRIHLDLPCLIGAKHLTYLKLSHRYFDMSNMHLVTECDVARFLGSNVLCDGHHVVLTDATDRLLLPSFMIRLDSP